MNARCAVAISSSNNQFNLVAVLAREEKDMPIVIVADDESRHASLAVRLVAALAVQSFTRVKPVALDRWACSVAICRNLANLAWKSRASIDSGFP